MRSTSIALAIAALVALSSAYPARADDAADDYDEEGAAADDDDDFSIPDAEVGPDGYAAPSGGNGVAFLETFQTDPFKGRWVKSSDEKFAAASWDWTTTYNGNRPGIDGDAGLVVAEGGRHYGAAAKVATPLSGADGDHLVVQYEVRLHDGLDCGGAYLKLLTTETTDLAGLTNDSPYSIMFGPDKCGGTNKVHFIFRFTNPVTGETEEKHMQSTVRVPAGSHTHLYTLVVGRADSTFSVSVDGVEKQSGSLLSADDVSPPLVPPAVIDDPDDHKPADWVDSAKMADPEAAKPDDWDEDAPAQVPDMDVEKPAGWEDDEAEFVADPEADKPDDWDDEDDGEWEAPEIENPKCAVGCGAWQRPSKANPEYKGKWSAPMVDNPGYVGEWKPQQVDNKAFFEDDDPVASFLPIGAVAVEIWTMSGGIHFDNVYLGSDPAAAKAFADATWAVKNPAEKAQAAQAKADAKRKERLEQLESGTVMGYASYYTGSVLDAMADNLVATIVSLTVGFGAFVWYCCIRDDGSEDAEGDDASSSADDADDEDEAEDAAEEEEEDATDGDDGEKDSGSDGSGDDAPEEKEKKVRKRKGRRMED